MTVVFFQALILRSQADESFTEVLFQVMLVRLVLLARDSARELN